ncbi:phasin family protein [Alkalicoccus saliphilus]|uniref:Polyhydroxyalkanoate synthesis regulator n=1 Tax=Alkalicoccus saliphilus TaxID=200989 RepID=A0A2T4U6J3_9BACI|nr:polyhydroxyalkanoate synthesis regulator [Alkalicoccus saliphilus]PTL38985.1 polyhydroxyalkanoate synthesis regulator [Alkalicoccus saliphilus]
MNNLIKSGFLLGLGAAVSSKERVDKYLDELMAKGKVTPAEADELYENLIKKGEETEEDWNRRTRERVREFLEGLNVVSLEDHEAVKSRVVELEERVKALESLHSSGSDRTE